MSPVHAYSILSIAIVLEVIGSTFLAKSDGFTRLWPTLGVVAFYVASFFLLSQALKLIPLGVAYAIWSGVGIVLTAMVGTLVLRQSLDFAAMAGIGMIIAGVLVINLFSHAGGH
jgi:small multidrug resistance pump